MKKTGGTGKTKGKTKAVKPVRHKEDTGGHGRAKKGTNPLALLILLPLVLATGGFLAWYYHEHGHFPLFVTDEQRQETLKNAKSTWGNIQQTTLDKWKMTQEKLAELDKKFSAEYEAYRKNQEAKQRETEMFLAQTEKSAPTPPPRQTAVRIETKPTPPPPVSRPIVTPPAGAVTTPPPPTPKPVDTQTPPPPTPHLVDTQTPPPPTPKPVDTQTPAPTPPEPVAPPPAPKYNPQEDTNFKAGAKNYDAAFTFSGKADSAEGEEAIQNYTEAIKKVNAAADSWQMVADKAKQENVDPGPFLTSIDNCKANAKVWENNIAELKKAAAAPPPAAEDNTGGSAAMGSAGGGFYGSNAKWTEGKKHFKEGYDIFTQHIGSQTGQDSHTLNKYIDQAVEKFNKAQECWDAAEVDWNKKYPGGKGPKGDLDMMDKAQGEVQFYRYACMKMHTFER